MRLERPLGHEALAARLWDAARREHLPHALCLEGPAGTGRFVLLRWLAGGLLCASGPGEPCLACGPCKRVQAGGAGGGHPDLLVIDPVEEGEEQIRIARIAQRGGGAGEGESVESFLALRSVEGGLRVILLREAHRMNHAAQNALLKTLEEPRDGTLLLLESERPDALLPTLRSRCMRVRTGRLSDADACRVLEAQGTNPARARELLRLAPGAPGAALAAERSGCEPLLALAADVLAGRLAPLAAAARVQELPAQLGGATPAAQARARASFALARLAALAGDLARAARGLPPALPAHAAILATIAGVPSEPRLERALLSLAECRADVARNLAPDPVLERALLVLGDLAPGAGASHARRARAPVRGGGGAG